MFLHIFNHLFNNRYLLFNLIYFKRVLNLMLNLKNFINFVPSRVQMQIENFLRLHLLRPVKPIYIFEMNSKLMGIVHVVISWIIEGLWLDRTFFGFEWWLIFRDETHCHYILVIASFEMLLQSFCFVGKHFLFDTVMIIWV
jgi:hypothetical protein